MNWLGRIFLILLPIFWSSCRTDFDTVPSSGNLQFSKDTVFLDTIFSNIGSSTYNLKVYNPSKEDINIPQIHLSNGEDSRYRLSVDGIPGKSFRNIEIPARDSIFIFIETTVDIEALAAEGEQLLYTDVIEFDIGENQQTVPLVTLVKDAVFLFPRKYEDGSVENISIGLNEQGEELRVKGFFLEEEELHFSNQKPYVIYGYAAVPPEKTLNIDPGARIHFHENSGLMVFEGASLKAIGDFSEDPNLLENEIIFEGDRLEPRFSDVPGQWGTIWLRPGSRRNVLDHVTIKNSDIGLWTEGNFFQDSPSLSISNTQIYNSAISGLLARGSHVTGQNLVINNSGQASLHLSQGGKYNFKHSTFTNYWNNGYRQYPAVLIENYLETPTDLLVADLIEANFSNCIIYGNQDREFLVFAEEEGEFNFSLENCLIKFLDRENQFQEFPHYDFSNEEYYRNLLMNIDPRFKGPQKNQLELQESSPARNRGNLQTASEVPVDILNRSRLSDPDLGAYEWASEPEE